MSRGVPPEHHPSLLDYVRSPFIAAGYDAYHAGNLLFRLDLDFLREELGGLPRGAAVLDIGCGTGRACAFLRRETDLEPVGADLSPHMLRLARERAGGAFVRADALALPFRSGCFGACLMLFSVLGMLRGSGNRLRAVREAARVLGPGGVFVFHVHNRSRRLLSPSGWKELAPGLARAGGLEPGDKVMRGYRGLPELFLHLFSLGEVKALLREGGFRVKRIGAVRPDRRGFLRGPAAALRADGFLVSAVRL